MNKLQKSLCLTLCICILFAIVPAQFVQAESGVIRIDSLEEFLRFAENCRLDSFSMEKTFRLTADIDLAETDFDGIPIFCGTFEGGGHIISGLKITSGGSAKGLFRYVEATATIRDLKVEGAVLPTGSSFQSGGIAGNNAGVIENCSFSGAVIGADYIGGIVGINHPGGVIRNCTAEGSIGGKHFVGGITGGNEGSIYNCTNSANINATVQQNDITISDITLDNLLNVESATATTDIGGIAGISNGKILGCVNRGNVGYPHMGYNVGGIAGLQSGYVADCENHGTVSGRKEVGGIVGQQEPEVVLNYSTDTLQILQAQISVLSDLVDRAVVNGNSSATNIKNLLYKIERYAHDAENAADYLKESLKKPCFEDLQSYADAIETIRDCVLGISNTLRSLWDAIGETMADLDRDMKAIYDQIAQIESTLNNAEANLGGQLLDTSDSDTADQLISKLENCNNFGSISGDLNIGGILGAVSFENDLDPEEDITVIGDTSLNAIGSFRSVILGCTNTGAVTVKYQRVGGIAGWLTVGLVKNCVNTGNVGSATADYAGGIAGDSMGYIRNCKVKSHIDGVANVGGIAGRGTIVSDCYAMVSLTGSEHMGGILGEAKQPYNEYQSPIQNNYYYMHGADLGGIDGISYEGKAKGLSLEIFLILMEEYEMFRFVTISFLADGEVISQSKLPTGSAFDRVPDVPQKTDCVGAWNGLTDADLQELVFDRTFHAVYTSYTTTIQSQITDDIGKPVLLLQGDFQTDASLILDTMDRLAGLSDGQKLLQGFEFTVEDCVSLHTGRLLLPKDADTDELLLLVRDANGNWTERGFRVDESYLVFSLGIGNTAIALVETEAADLLSPEVMIAAGVGALATLAVWLIITRVRKRKVAKSSENVTA